MNHDRLQHLFGLLGSQHDGEILNAVHAMRKMLDKSGVKFHQLRIANGAGPGKVERNGETLRLRKEVNALNGQLQRKSAVEQVLRSQIEQLQGEVATLRDGVVAMKDDLAEAQKRAVEAEELSARYCEQIATMEGQLDAIRVVLDGKPAEKKLVEAPAKKLEAEKPVRRRKRRRKAMTTEKFVEMAQARFGNQRGWQAETARYLNISPVAVSKYVRGLAAIPADVAERISAP